MYKIIKLWSLGFNVNPFVTPFVNYNKKDLLTKGSLVEHFGLAGLDIEEQEYLLENIEDLIQLREEGMTVQHTANGVFIEEQIWTVDLGFEREYLISLVEDYQDIIDNIEMEAEELDRTYSSFDNGQTWLSGFTWATN